MIKDNKLYRILVIEDNIGDFTIVDDLLNDEIVRPQITHAEDYRTASEFLADNNQVFDIILLDLTLPDKSGQSLITEILNLAASRPIIILTGLSDIELSIKFISQGISDYLLKDDLNSKVIYKSITYAIERRKVISELEESKRRYSNLFHLSPQPMWLYDSETYQFLQVNVAATEHYGYSEEEFLGMTVVDIRLEEDKEGLRKFLLELKDRKDAINRGKYRHKKKNGEVIDVEIYSTPIIIDNRNCRSVVSIDVTDKKLYEQRLIRTIIQTQEDERYELGSELHDNVCQILATSLINLGMLKKSVDSKGQFWFDQSKETINMAVKEIRNLSHRIAPKFFDDTTFENAIIKLFNSFNVEEQYKTTLNFDEKIKAISLNKDIQLNFYRILQEQLKNIFKYANASTIEVSITLENNHLKMSIKDNGVGFDVEKVQGGIGISNMKRRAELFAGKLEIKSRIGEGCEVLV